MDEERVPHRRLPLAGCVALATGALLISSSPAVADPGGNGRRAAGEYRVERVATRADRTAIARTGAAVNYVESGTLHVTATPDEVNKIEQLGYDVAEEPGQAPKATSPGTYDFPPDDSGYHNYAELTAEVDKVITDHPALAAKTVIGQSYEGRDITAVKISDNPTVDEAEPEVLFTHNQHAREHLTVEMAIYLINQLTDGYASDSQIQNLVDNREIWIVPTVNPDGAEYDIATGSYQSWRKNRQPTSGTNAVGADLNRNWGYQWGCCGGSSGNPSSDTYRGPAAESAPEVRAVADFVRSRVIGGVQQITTSIDFHSYGELVLWPYGYTYDDTPPDMDADDAEAFEAIGRSMASSNGYTPQQSSDLYITDGSITDYLWGAHKIFAYAFEMYPKGSSGGGFYPPDEVISRETSRNREAVLHLLEYSDCPYRAIGQSCAA